MTIIIKSTRDVVLDGVKAAVYGGAGVGKTRLCATAPMPIIISAESGLLSLRHYDLPYIETNSLEEVNEAYDFIRDSDEAKQYETVCLDSLSEVCEALLAEFKPTVKDPRQAYMKLADSAGAAIRKFRDLKGKNVLFTAKMAKKEDEESGTFYYEPMLPGRVLPHGLPYLVDEVFCMQIADISATETKPAHIVRYLQTYADSKRPCKDRSGALDKNEQPDFGKIIEKIVGDTNGKTD